MKLQDRQKTDKKYYDRGTHVHRSLKPREGVRVWNPQREVWKPAVVEQASSEPRSYVVRTEDGSRLCRNRQDIRVSPEVKIVPEPEPTIVHSDHYDPSPQHVVETPQVSNQYEPQVSDTVEPKSIIKAKPVESQSVVEPRRSKRVRFTPSKYNDYVVK